jgi:hypothetical protein
MSAAPRILEGTWEDVVKHASELAGHHLKVIVMDKSGPLSSQFELSPEEWVARFRKWATSGPPITHFVDDSRDTIYQDRLK